MDNRVLEFIAQRDDGTKQRESKNVRTILSPISMKKQPIYLSNYPTYRGRTLTRKANVVNDPKEACINNEDKENLDGKQFVNVDRENREIVEDKSKSFSDRSNNWSSSRQQERLPTLLTFEEKNGDGGTLKRKIPRPANAFMLFANEWRKKLANENPRESNKDISVRLVSLT
ncbi:hypothetical protein KPH14_004196 [Odynerus spinipes]|uniref:Sex-determining region Y protein n=1 Tax=Odynerus spinipes TaxID=1348599 RepID=A0AAD9RYA9_9HYME|nr:hypothetical protein KPH14_004196 [Odynerus spinipes]